jgi:hypothetical protein
MKKQNFFLFGWGCLIVGSLTIVYWHYWLSPHLPPPPPIKERACQQTYIKLFQKETIDIRIVFGYKDARPARFVGDRYEKNALIESLQEPCQRNRMDCGFNRSESDAEIFWKNIIGIDQKIHKIILRVLNSSVGPDDDENRKDPFQIWQSERAEKSFFSGINKADIIFYNGHARDGGGPDFAPPRIRADRQVNYNWYTKHKPGFKKLSHTLSIANKNPKLVGLFSCASKKLIPKNPKAKQLAWLTYNNLIYYADALESMRDTLSDILTMKCQDEFKAQIAEATLSGFF